MSYPYCEITTDFQLLPNSDDTYGDFQSGEKLNLQGYNDIREYNTEWENKLKNKGVGFFDTGKLKFKEDGVYLVELIYMPIKRHSYWNYESPFKFLIEDTKFLANNNKQHIDCESSDLQWHRKIKNAWSTQPIYSGISGALCLFKVTQGKIERITQEEENTTLLFDCKLKFGLNYVDFEETKHFAWGKCDTQAYFIPADNDIVGKFMGLDDMFKLEEDYVRLVYHKFIKTYKKHIMWSRLLGLCVYKLF